MANDFDRNRFDDIILALLWANSFEEPGGHRAWKSLDWDALDRLHGRGLISNPRSRTHSVTLSEAACQRGRERFEQYFAGTTAEEKPAATSARSKARKATANPATVHQFKISLDGIKPPVWRRIQLHSDASFWDLHCAINDAMGWQDMHLHAFHVDTPGGYVEIGIPTDEEPWSDTPPRVDWEVATAEYFDKPKTHGAYLYDFGDGWSHRVVLEAIVPREAGVKYPRCLDGARACPPEDCGGLPGYQQLCAVLADPASADEEGEELLEWLGEDYDPDRFDPSEVRFIPAKRRLKALRDAG